MSWRTVIISSRCKLDLSMGYMVVRGEEMQRVYLDEIETLIIESTAVSLTGCLIAALTEHKIKVIFCDEKRNPSSELLPYAGSHDSSKKIKMQLSWAEDLKLAVWTQIVIDKITKQAVFLEKINKEREAALLHKYITEVAIGDTTNREGHAAKVYFNAVFGMDFTRNAECLVNAALNYGYSLILSAVNREIAADGYLSQIGLHHDNVFNAFNLGSDLMEPFRVLVDRLVYHAAFAEFGPEEKRKMVSLLHEEIAVEGTKQTVANAVKMYVRSVFNALNNRDPSNIHTAVYEL